MGSNAFERYIILVGASSKSPVTHICPFFNINKDATVFVFNKFNYIYSGTY